MGQSHMASPEQSYHKLFPTSHFLSLNRAQTLGFLLLGTALQSSLRGSLAVLGTATDGRQRFS